MLIKEGISRITTLYNKGAKSSSSRLSDRHVYSVMKTIRTLLIKREADKKKIISDWDIDILPCVELIEAPLHECPCIPPTGCKVMRSKYKLPKPISLNDGDLIIDVTSLDNSQSFDKSSWKQERNRKGSKYTSKYSTYFIKNDYLYITHNKDISIVMVSGIFEDSIEVAQFKGKCDSEDSNSLICSDVRDVEFKIDSHLEQAMIEMCIKEILDLFNRGIEDQETNARSPKISNYQE